MPPRGRIAMLMILLMLAAPAQALAPGRVVLVVLDGGGERVLGRLLDAGRMPRLQAISRRGVRPMSLWPPSIADSASVRAALWCGEGPAVNGVSGDRRPALPRREHAITEVEPGEHATSLLTPPLWTLAARAGRRVVVLQASHLQPLSAYGAEGVWGGAAAGRLTLFDPSTAPVLPDEVVTSTSSLRPVQAMNGLLASGLPPLAMPLELGTMSLAVVLTDDPRDPVRGYDTAQLRLGPGPGPILKPGRAEVDGLSKFSFPIPVQLGEVRGTVAFRLFELAPDASSLRLYRSPLVREESNRPSWLPAWQAQVGSPVPQGAEEAYVAGRLGRTLMQGGNGDAERWLLETVRLSLASRTERLRTAARTLIWDLLIDEVPYPDRLLHLWAGIMDERSPLYRPLIGPRLWLFIEDLGRMLDAYVGTAEDVTGGRAALAVVGLHGLESVGWDIAPNVALRRAGLLALDLRGQVDLARTRALYAPSNGGFVLVNSTERPGGIVPPAEVGAVVDRAMRVLRDQRDPLTRRRVFAALYPAQAAEPRAGLGGEAGGELYLDPAPGYGLVGDLKGGLVRPHVAWRTGEHGFLGQRPGMQGLLVLAGPGVRQSDGMGVALGTELTPALLSLLGVAMPQGWQERVWPAVRP